jgi:hypothetical protein
MKGLSPPDIKSFKCLKDISPIDAQVVEPSNQQNEYQPRLPCCECRHSAKHAMCGDFVCDTDKGENCTNCFFDCNARGTVPIDVGGNNDTNIHVDPVLPPSATVQVSFNISVKEVYVSGNIVLTYQMSAFTATVTTAMIYLNAQTNTTSTNSSSPTTNSTTTYSTSHTTNSTTTNSTSTNSANTNSTNTNSTHTPLLLRRERTLRSSYGSADVATERANPQQDFTCVNKFTCQPARPHRQSPRMLQSPWAHGEVSRPTTNGDATLSSTTWRNICLEG